MRIEKLRLRNLNSLAGEWVVDFTHPAFAQSGIFAITGPTGAGKSTVLDAISLALYGRTPRLARLTKNDNAIMSAGTADCLAEVTFRTRKGRFRSCWFQRRSRNKPDGALQKVHHELADADTGKILEERPKETLLRVEDATGMDYERFSRSVLLPQGRFADFLAADAPERAPLLEQITGTEIYRDISVAVHRRERDEQTKLEALRAELQTFRLMAEDEEAAAAHEITEKKAQRETAAAHLAHEEECAAWLKTLADLRARLAGTASALEAKQTEARAFAPGRARLADAERALELAGTYAELTQHRAELRRTEQDEKICAAALPDLRTRAAAALAERGAADQTLKTAREQRDADAPLHAEVRALDAALREKESPLRAARAEAKRLTAESGEEECSRREKALRTAVDAHEALRRLHAEKDEAARALLAGKSEADWLAARDALEQRAAEEAFADRAHSFAAERERLRDGEPCPLCGAAHHPFASGNAPAPDKSAEETARDLAHAKRTLAALQNLRAETAGLTALHDSLERVHICEKTRDASLHARALADAARRTLAALQTEYEKFAADRAALFGARGVDAEEAARTTALRKAELSAESARRALDAANAGVSQTEKRLADSRAALSSRRAALAESTAAFTAAAAAKGFPDEQTYAAACLPEPERAALRSRAAALDGSLLELSARDRDTRAQLEAETARALTSDAPEAIAARAESLRADTTRLDRDIGALAERLRANAAASALRRGRFRAAEAQEKECVRWGKLHALIGSHDGSKYRVFAQGITFEIMLGHANRQLARLSDRYVLVRDAEEPLSLCVLDAYQAGTRRTAKNLSGGESFIVSLALALGLSTMAGKTVRVDSLFLDEGFGALDAETLDTALDTLSRLRTEGKLVCAISHVPEVAARIPVRIELTPAPGGTSTLAGPGCGRGE